MGSGFLDIIFFAVIAAFLVFRLRSQMGRRDGHDGSGYQDPFKPANQSGQRDDNVVTLPDRSGDLETDVLNKVDENDPLSAGLTQIRIADGTFTPDEFLVGSRVAFEMILNAFSSGDEKALEPLLDDGVFANFAAAIRDRDAEGSTVEDTLVGIKSADIVEAYMEGRVANVTVKFVTEQVNVTKNAEGEVIEGNPNQVIQVTDFWTFGRDTKSRDPNWVLVATHSAD